MIKEKCVRQTGKAKHVFKKCKIIPSHAVDQTPCFYYYAKMKKEKKKKRPDLHDRMRFN